MGLLFWVPFSILVLALLGNIKKIWEATDDIMSTPLRIAVKIIIGAIFLPFVSSELLEGLFWLKARILIWVVYTMLYFVLITFLSRFIEAL